MALTTGMLVPEDAACTSYFGWLAAPGGRRFLFRIVGVAGGALRGAELKPSRELGSLLRPCAETVKSLLLQSATLDAFMVELEAIVARLVGASDAPFPSAAGAAASSSSTSSAAAALVPTTALFARIADELAAVGWDKVRNVDDSFRRLELVCHDQARRAHLVRLELPVDYPRTQPRCVLSVPAATNSGGGEGTATTTARREWQVAWPAGERALTHVLAQASRWLDVYSPFWAEMDDFDANTWVLEPSRPSRADTLRRIALRRHCSVEITLKPHRPRDVCACNFIGPESVIAGLRDAFHSGQRTWDASVPVRSNLERILGQPFPSPTTSSKSDFSVECGVCYSYRLSTSGAPIEEGDDAPGGETVLLPDTTCESCGQHFHARCIGEWLQALPSSRRSFNVVFGECPYCMNPLSVQIGN